MNIADLPTDIIYYIVDYVIVGVYVPQETFSKALPVLWISRNWRLVALDSVYSYAYLEDRIFYEPLESEQSRAYVVETNFELICRNKLQHLVKRLEIVDYIGSYNDDVEFLANFIIKLGSSGTSPMRKITNYTFDGLTKYIATLSNGKPDKIDAGLGATLARTFQNVKCIDVKSNTFRPDDSAQIDRLVAGYGSQLVSVKCHGYSMCPNLLPADKVTDIDIVACIKRGDSNLQHVTLFHSKFLQTFKLKYDRNVHLCGLFCKNPDSNMIDFKNLRRLELIGSDNNSGYALYDYQNYMTNANMCTHGLSFPALVDLRVENYFIFRSEFECLLHAPLRRISFSGLLTQFLLQFYNKLPSTLKYLKLDLLFNELIDDFTDAQRNNAIRDYNIVLSSLQGIESVELVTEPYYFEFGIDCTNVTHLNLKSTYRNICDVFDITDNAPHLVMLTYFAIDADFRADLEILLNIKKRYPCPSSSKIHTAYIEYGNYEMYDTLKDALENLKWCWPNLRNIIYE